MPLLSKLSTHFDECQGCRKREGPPPRFWHISSPYLNRLTSLLRAPRIFRPYDGSAVLMQFDTFAIRQRNIEAESSH